MTKPTSRYGVQLADGGERPLRTSDLDGAIAEARRLRNIPDQTVDVSERGNGVVATTVDIEE